MRYSILSLNFFIWSILFCAGCGGSSGASYTATCSNYRTTSGLTVCTDYYGGTTAQVQSICSSGGTYSTTLCATANRIGSCNETNPVMSYITRYYSPTTVSAAQSDCASVTVNGVPPTFTTD